MIYLGVKMEKVTKKAREEGEADCIANAPYVTLLLPPAPPFLTPLSLVAGSPSVVPDKSKSDPPPIEKPLFYCNICRVEVRS